MATLTNNPLSYEDVRTVMDRALEAPHGVRVTVATPGKAVHYKQRAHKFRLLDRENNCAIYSPGDPMYGSSVYDGLQLTVFENAIVITKIGPPLVEELTE